MDGKGEASVRSRRYGLHGMRLDASEAYRYPSRSTSLLNSASSVWFTQWTKA